MVRSEINAFFFFNSITFAIFAPDKQTDIIKHALGISGVSSRESVMIARGTKKDTGMQLDLLIDRDDYILNVCEMKYVRTAERIPSAYEQKIAERQTKVEQASKDKTIHMTLVSTCPYSNANDVFQSVVTTDDLFVM